MIPKIIHYCWFGRKPKSKLIEKCINSWKKILPDYKILEWNEDNFDVNCIKFTEQAYKAKKYAFVSDYARFYILFQYGGIYLDVDVEVLKPLDIFLVNEMFTGFESKEGVNPGLIIGAEKECLLIKEFMDNYDHKEFFLPDTTLNTETVVTYVTNILINKGLELNGNLQNIAKMTIYPEEFFSPKSYFTKKTIITENTFTIHHYAGSWIPWYVKAESKFWKYCRMKDRHILARISGKLVKIKGKLL